VVHLAISYYIALSRYKDYGALGATLAPVTWVFLSSLIVFAGGEFTAVFVRRYGNDPWTFVNGYAKRYSPLAVVCLWGLAFLKPRCRNFKRGPAER
jgi:uncharacterized BrkB/YihY/UPF0761 family membrane protein